MIIAFVLGWFVVACIRIAWELLVLTLYVAVIAVALLLAVFAIPVIVLASLIASLGR